MPEYKTFAVIGGDLRQAHIANRLMEQDNMVYAFLLEKNAALHKKLRDPMLLYEVLPTCDVVILPLPMTSDGKTISSPFSDAKLDIKECFALISPKTVVLAGRVDDESRRLADELGINLIDYFVREELAVRNAVITAEGALSIAIEETPISIFGSHCLVTGHGRIARSLIRALKAMGARVSVGARKQGDLAEIEAEGCQAVHINAMAKILPTVDIIFNTVPARLFTRALLSRVKNTALLIDLASKPGGVDLEAAGDLRIKTIWALSLPGKTAPISAGEIILDTILNCLAEQEEL